MPAAIAPMRVAEVGIVQPCGEPAPTPRKPCKHLFVECCHLCVNDRNRQLLQSSSPRVTPVKAIPVQPKKQ